MVYYNRIFPTNSRSSRWEGVPGQAHLQSPGIKLNIGGVEELYPGSLNYLEFISLVKKIWEESHPSIPIVPVGVNLDTFSQQVNGKDITSIIGYALELRKTHTVEPKPRMRQNVENNRYTIYGQKYQNIVSFSPMMRITTLQGSDPNIVSDDMDAAVMCDQIIEAFEDFMLEYTPIFKAAGASELVYSRRLADSEINRDGSDIHKRTVTYMLTTEKTFAIENARINSILVDIRNWMAYESQFVNSLATPNYENIATNIVDLNQTATPNTA